MCVTSFGMRTARPGLTSNRQLTLNLTYVNSDFFSDFSKTLLNNALLRFDSFYNAA